MKTIAFFGHDSGDAAVRRRVRALSDDGFDIIGYMPKRRADKAADWQNVELGMTRDGAFLNRIKVIFTGAWRASRPRNNLKRADLIYARNLDMLACAFLAKRFLNSKTPVIYECLDVHRMMCRQDFIGRSLRAIEGALLKRCAGLVVSSPGFLKNYFSRYHEGLYRAVLVENRLAAGADYGTRTKSAAHLGKNTPLKLGWVGNLRCKVSLGLLADLADHFGPRLEVHLHGQPARTEIEVFEPVIEQRANMFYHGRYRSPEDLAAIYGGLDIVWAGDFMEAGFNSEWLLPNRIYEGGYYITPSVAPAGTQTAHWIASHDCGFLVEQPLAQTLAALIETLMADPSLIDAKARALLAMDEHVFIQPSGFMRAMISEVMAEEASI